MMKTSIYKFHSVSEFLRHSYEEKRRNNSRFSIRAWAKLMGLKSPTSLHAVIHGKRKIPLSYHGILAKTLQLTAEESYYLLVLISFEHAKNDLQKLTYLEKLQTLRNFKDLTMLELANFEFLSEPLYTCIVEMTELVTFRNDPSWIQKNNRISKDINQIKTALTNLLERGFLKLENGSVLKSNRNTTNVPD
ncbi:MAG: TIGR02147 family protein, partial [Proteobacteria bacterium]